MLGPYFCSFSKSLISFKSFTSSGSAGGGAGFASSFFLKLLKNLTTKKRTSAVIKKLMIAWINKPTAISAAPILMMKTKKSILRI